MSRVRNAECGVRNWAGLKGQNIVAEVNALGTGVQQLLALKGCFNLSVGNFCVALTGLDCFLRSKPRALPHCH